MNRFSLVIAYATRLARREWKRFLLPLLSLGITAIVLSLTLLLTSASSKLLNDQSKQLLGGDVVVESKTEIPPDVLLNNFSSEPDASSTQMSFTATIESGTNALTVSMRVVDRAFPLYGETVTDSGKYHYPLNNEIILDQSGAEQLKVKVGDTVVFGNTPYTVSDILVTEPTSLIGSFRFFPRVLIGFEGFARSGIEPALLRPEYEYSFKTLTLSSVESERFQTFATDSNGLYQVEITGENRSGLQAGLGLVRDFLIIAVLITAILSTVNVYASTVYLINVERKSFAIMLALGLTSRRLVMVLGLALSYVVLLSTFVGVLIGKGLFLLIRNLVEQRFTILLPHPEYVMVQIFTAIFLFIIAFSAFIPTLQYLLSLRPKQILAGDTGDDSMASQKNLLMITGITLAPLMLASVWLLDNFVQGVTAVVGVAIVYVVVAGLFSVLLTFLYKIRHLFSFRLRSVIAHKRADGLFGIISFTSLFVALTALSTLILLQVSLERYLTNDLSKTVPSTYVIDVQPSQREALMADFAELTLFSNTQARIIAIDDLRVQDELANGSDQVDRELGREFNITARDYLLESEKITAGQPWTGNPGEISVDEEFAKRIGISLGSTVTFSIQGFLIEGRVTSMRETDSRSGLPFFYFVLSPVDLEQFPTVYFGYAYQDEAEQMALSRYLAGTMPNVTIFKTQTLAPLVLQITSLLILVILTVSIPPLTIATLLIVTMIISSYSVRRLEAGRQRALGATKNQVLTHYLLETSILTVGASIMAYISGVLVANILSQYFFKLDSVVLFDTELLLALITIVIIVLTLAIYLFKGDKMELRELLSYGDN